LSVCIGFRYGILIKIQKTWKEAYKAWFNGWKSIHIIKNIIILDHHELIIYIDIDYLGFYHDFNILYAIWLYINTSANTSHKNKYFEYLLVDLGMLMNKCLLHAHDMFKWKCIPNVDHDVMKV
jgi:hypothetical protein